VSDRPYMMTGLTSHGLWRSFLVMDMNEDSPCFREYRAEVIKQTGQALDDLGKASKH